jgi:hypothetical protein
MTHTHDDRVADRPSHLCAAYGCPLIGTSTASTIGGSEWWCFAHFGADVGRYQAITSELNRLRWLSAAARDVRFHDKSGTEASRAAFALIENELTQHQRPDLLWDRTEKRTRWLERLEAALKTELADVMHSVPKQVAGQPAGTFSRVEFDMPA